MLLALLVLVAVLGAVPSSYAADQILTDAGGRILVLNASHNLIGAVTDLYLPDPTWSNIGTMAPWSASDLVSTATLNRMEFFGRIRLSGGTSCTYDEVLDELPDATHCQLTVTAETNVSLAGVFFYLRLPVADFTSGTCVLHAAGGSDASVRLPAVQPGSPQILTANAAKAMFVNAAGDTSVTLALDATRSVTLQDDRQWGGNTYSAFFSFGPGTLLAGQSCATSYTLSASKRADSSVAHLSVAPSQVRYRLDGIGGDYCFDPQAPDTSYTLNALNSGWARTEASLALWEPTNANLTSDTAWATLAAHDVAGSDLHAEFLLAQAIQRRGIPYMKTVWRLPEWAYTDPGQPPWISGRRVDPARWDDILRCIGSYLLYARAIYGAEPDLFSFNESNIGANVLFTPEEHRDMIQRVGAHLEQLGLKTRMVLGDTGSVPPIGFTQATLADAAAMHYVGALSVHSWGGATPAQYAAWGDLATSLGLPLLVAEVGVDPQAWQSPAELANGIYALQEVQMYQDILRYARPQGTMQWEFTDDYGLLAHIAGPGGTQLEPTRRFWYLKQFCNLTPHGSDALATSSDQSQVSITAFRVGIGREAQYVLHVANLGSARAAIISGIPTGMQFRAIRTGESENYQEIAHVAAAPDGIHLSLAPQSLLTLVGEGYAPPAASTWDLY